jgi:hypothetical protein
MFAMQRLSIYIATDNMPVENSTDLEFYDNQNVMHVLPGMMVCGFK